MKDKSSVADYIDNIIASNSVPTDLYAFVVIDGTRQRTPVGAIKTIKKTIVFGKEAYFVTLISGKTYVCEVDQLRLEGHLSTQEPKYKVGDYFMIEKFDLDGEVFNPFLVGMSGNFKRLADLTHLYDCPMCIGRITRITSRGFYNAEFYSLANISEAGIDFFKYMQIPDNVITPITEEEYNNIINELPIRKMIAQAILNTAESINSLIQKVNDTGRGFTYAQRVLNTALEEQTKQIGVIKKEKEAKIKDDLKIIQKDKRIKELKLCDNGVKITTYPLTLTCVNEDMLNEYSALPAYNVHINFTDSSTPLVKININHEQDYTADNRKYITLELRNAHPNVGTDGSPCLGNIAMLFSGTVASMDIKNSIRLILDYLESYSNHNPYISIEVWQKLTIHCTQCNALNIFKVCPSCGHKQNFRNKKLLKKFIT